MYFRLAPVPLRLQTSKFSTKPIVRDRCYDFESFSPKKLSLLTHITVICAEINAMHNILFEEKRKFVCRKLLKIAENGDHNIDPKLYRQCKMKL
jgi:hypothetical protein